MILSLPFYKTPKDDRMLNTKEDNAATDITAQEAIIRTLYNFGILISTCVPPPETLICANS
jgi:hypothetical protein